MEASIITYLAKAAVSTAFFWLLHMVFLRKDKFLHIRRIHFFFALLFSLAFPFISIEIPVNETAMPVYWLGQFDDTIVIPPSDEKVTYYGPQSVILIAGAIIAVMLAMVFLIRFLSIIKLRQESNTVEMNGSKVVMLKDKEFRAFSFFKWIFIPIGYKGEDLQEIITHEQVHINQLHTIDVVVFELFCIVFWWNPFAWLLKREMKINLEYLADEGVIKQGFDTQSYQYILLQCSNKNTHISIVNNFNVSQLKKRIAMMNKKKTSIILSAKYLLALPVATLLILGNIVQASPELIDKTIINSHISSILQYTEITDDDKPYLIVEQMPAYPGGENEMYKFIQNNLKYPANAKKISLQDRVIVRFIVSKDGSITKAKVLRGISSELDAEVLRVVNAMPKWTPGKEKGKIVPVYYTLPIVFKITGNHVDIISRIEKSETDEEKPFITVEELPSYPGGESEMMKFIRDNLTYPESAQKAGIQGRITLRFVVRADGTITDAKVLRGIFDDCDEEVLKMISLMPKWKPGKQNGKAVPVYFTLPIVFSMEKNPDNSSK